MLGIILTGLFCLGAIGVGNVAVGRWAPKDPIGRVGVFGLVGLGILGTATFVLLMAPSGSALAWLAVALAAYGIYRAAEPLKAIDLPKPEGADWLFPVAYIVLMLLAFIGVLATPSAIEWDSLAYHLAVPKLWAAAGRAEYISFIHHSNFPQAVDSLFYHGLIWGGTAGAKAFSIAFYKFGALAIFGEARSRWNNVRTAWFSALAYLSVPVLLWEAGTAYVDLGHGLFAGLAIWFAAKYASSEERGDAVLGLVFAGFAVGSKYTGLITFFIVGVMILAAALRGQQKLGPLIGAVAICLAIGAPGYVRNVVNTGNPVFPFMYSRFGGKNWDAYNAEIYSNEQATFGVSREVPEPGKRSIDMPSQPSKLGAAILGLAYQPGRYTNPNPLSGFGWPYHAIGFVAIATLMLAMIGGGLRRDAKFVVLGVFGVLLGWTAMSEQSRYISTIAIPLAIMLGDLRGVSAMVIRFGVSMQTLVAAYVIHSMVMTPQLEQMKSGAPATRFSEAAEVLNHEIHPKRVALFNEVFGYLLDAPYFWANPGHSTEMGYAALNDGNGFADALKRLGCDHAYLAAGDAPEDKAMFAAMQDPSTAYHDADSEEVGIKWRRLFVDAVRSGRLKPIKALRRGVIFKID